MKHLYIISSIIFFVFTSNSQITDTTKTDTVHTIYEQPKWGNNTVRTIKKGSKEIGLFSPLKIGLKDSIEITVHPIYFFIIPHIEVKKQWKLFSFIDIGTKHKFSYPTLLLKTISKNGIAGILPSNSKIPHIFKFNNAILFGKTINKNFTATLTAGAEIAFQYGKSSFPDIEYHILYPRTYSYNHIFTYYIGANFIGKIVDNIYFDYDVTYFNFINKNRGYNLENKLKIQWNISDKFAIKGGILIINGDYPYGMGSGIFPLFDLMYKF